MFRRGRCTHPLRFREGIWNGVTITTQCALCGHIFEIRSESPEKETIMDISALKSEAEAVINEATNIVDLADKWADRVRPLLADVPTVGPEAQVAVTVLDELDKALHEAKNVLSAL